MVILYKKLMFIGQFTPNFSSSSRFALPKKIRDEIGDSSLVLSRGFEGCIFGFRISDWEKEAKKIDGESVTDKRTRNLKRYLYSGAAFVSIDNQGRVVIPSPLKEYAGIKRSVVVLGAGDHFEIWDKERWDSYLPKMEVLLNE